jgi:hypothetical protein
MEENQQTFSSKDRGKNRIQLDRCKKKKTF